MKINTCLALGVIITLSISLPLPPPAFSMDDSGFTINRMVISKDVVEKETDNNPQYARILLNILL